MLFNTECRVGVSPRSLGPAGRIELPAVKGFGYWKDIAAFRPVAQWSVGLNCEGGRFALTVRGPIGHTLYLPSVPATRLPARRQALYLESTGRAAAFEFCIAPATAQGATR